ncbi:Uncharacterized protein TPAR_08841 [Tolypocladium paradoxum]|uniref:Uncharacterized protein n=1 Tax=Tolypocladium paradoxum TaxID=94208 RepID=A0A2S4KL70_9HYPO|nr:Uncharacterized protein TPAR_08841 [Tolypocladium paradoxum]
MASRTNTMEAAAAKALLEHCFLNLNDSTMGACVWEYEQQGFPYSTEGGLDFCKEHVVMNKRVQSILKFYFNNARCCLYHWLRWKADPAIECFLKGGSEAGRVALLVHLLPRGSRLRYFPGSHLRNLPTREHERATYEVKESALEQAGLFAENEVLRDGGIVIRDARLCVRIAEGYAITFGFATQDLVTGKPKMLLPNLNALKRKVAEMEGPGIGVNFAFANRDGSLV